MAISPKLGLPLLSENQSAAEFVFNETMYKLDAVTQLQAKNYINDPPTGVEGEVYLVGLVPTTLWEDNKSHIAYYISGWKFVIPHEGMVAYVTTGTNAGTFLRFDTINTGWIPHIGNIDTLQGHIVVPIARDYCVELKAQAGYTITKLTAQAGAGGCSVAIKYTTPADVVTTETALVVGTSQVTQAEDVDVVVSGKVELVVTIPVSCLDLQFQIDIKRDTL